MLWTILITFLRVVGGIGVLAFVLLCIVGVAMEMHEARRRRRLEIEAMDEEGEDTGAEYHK